MEDEIMSVGQKRQVERTGMKETARRQPMSAVQLDEE